VTDRDSSGEAEYKKTLDTCVIDRRVSPDITSVSISIFYVFSINIAPVEPIHVTSGPNNGEVNQGRSIAGSCEV
jgi:hypothetical protein